MFLVKRIVGLRVLYIYSFTFGLVELGMCTRIRGFPSVDLGCETLRALAIPCIHDPEAANCAFQSVVFGSYSSSGTSRPQVRFSPITLRQATGEMSKSKMLWSIDDFSTTRSLRSARMTSCMSTSTSEFPATCMAQKKSLLRFLDSGPEVERRLAPGTVLAVELPDGTKMLPWIARSDSSTVNITARFPQLASAGGSM